MALWALAGLLAAWPLRPVHAADPHASDEGHGSAAKTYPVKKPVATEAIAKEMGEQLREALKSGDPKKKQLTLVVESKDKPQPPAVRGAVAAPSARYVHAGTGAQVGHGPAAAPAAKAAPAHDVHWSYEGEGGPQAWGRLKPEYIQCATGKRQSPIHIEESMTLQGPAEAIQFSYQASNGTVINNGHTIQVDVYGDNFITVRGMNYKLLQFHFHNPSEERVNYKAYAMVAHLVHRNLEGQLAVVAVLLDPGLANSLIHKVWTYMPLDAGDNVRMPTGLVDLNELLPKDRRYYQFLGSLTTPPCTEGVLWMVLKQPVDISREQLKLFGQLFPHNARPVQPVNGRPIRDAQ
jgi:carbonic anhydrase